MSPEEKKEISEDVIVLNKLLVEAQFRSQSLRYKAYSLPILIQGQSEIIKHTELLPNKIDEALSSLNLIKAFVLQIK